MLLLKAILVVLIAEIEPGSTSSAKGNEEAKTQLPPDSYINVTDENGCWYPQIVDIEGGSFMGFLALNCTKTCPNGENQIVVDGNRCTVTIQVLSKDEVNVTAGSCALGCCNPDSPPQHRIIPLMSAADDEEEKKKDKKKKNKKKNKNNNKSKNKDQNKQKQKQEGFIV
uniref:Putative evasin n=1 Tax=Ixodes ricinus TaxID=34613 RepID=A0A6B0UZR9_IXORI